MRLFDLALLLGVIALPSAGAGYVISGPGATAHTGVDPQDFARIDLDGDGQADIELEVTGAYAFVSSAPNSTLDFTADPVENGALREIRWWFWW